MDNLRFGLDMTLFGMGTVFLLLILLMLILYALGALDRPRKVKPRKVKASDQPGALMGDPDPDDPANEPEAAPEPEPDVRILADGLTDDQIAAITIAVLTHAQVRRREAAPVMRRYFPGTRLYASRWVTAGRAGQHTPWARPTRPGNGS